MEIFFFWIVFSFVPAFVAPWRGRSALVWFGLGLLISPLIATIILLIAPDLKKAGEKAAEQALRMPYPFCGEAVMKTAKICPFCRSDLASKTAAPARAPAPPPPQRPAAQRVPAPPLPPVTPRPPGSSPFTRPPRGDAPP